LKKIEFVVLTISRHASLLFFTPKALKGAGFFSLLLIANPFLKLSPGGSAKYTIKQDLAPNLRHIPHFFEYFISPSLL
jgi:hypothetical protein